MYLTEPLETTWARPQRTAFALHSLLARPAWAPVFSGYLRKHNHNCSLWRCNTCEQLPSLSFYTTGTSNSNLKQLRLCCEQGEWQHWTVQADKILFSRYSTAGTPRIPYELMGSAGEEWISLFQVPPVCSTLQFDLSAKISWMLHYQLQCADLKGYEIPGSVFPALQSGRASAELLCEAGCAVWVQLFTSPHRIH